jgi:hypothetical protein
MASWGSAESRADSHINGEAPPWLAQVWRRWLEFEACAVLVREGRACFLLRWHAFTFGPGPGDDRYPVPQVNTVKQSLDSSSPLDGH